MVQSEVERSRSRDRQRESSRSRDRQRHRAAGIRIAPDVLRSAVHVGVLQAAWPVIAERFPYLSEEEDLFVQVLGSVYVVQFVRQPADWELSIIHLNDQGVRLPGPLFWQLPCWMPAAICARCTQHRQ